MSNETFPINSFLICVDAYAAKGHDFKTLIEFVTWRHSVMDLNAPSHATICITTGGRKSDEVVQKIRAELREKNITTSTPYGIISSSNPDYHHAMDTFKRATGFEHKDLKVLFLCVISIRTNS